jgi:hypothetical protein
MGRGGDRHEYLGLGDAGGNGGGTSSGNAASPREKGTPEAHGYNHDNWKRNMRLFFFQFCEVLFS